MESPGIEGFRFEKMLAQSSRSVLWRAKQEALERDVLVAVLQPEALEDAPLADSIFAIARTIARVKTPLVPDVIDIIRTDEQAYVILEDAHAQNVVQLLNGRLLTPQQAIELASRLAKGFQSLRDAHLVYGGLRPKTLYLVDSTEPLLPDFSPMNFEAGYGDAPVLEPTGSPPYVAPEQYLMPEAVDTRADMFALGMTLYALTTGQIPFGALQAEEILQAKLSFSIPSPCDLVPNFPQALAELMARLGQRDPQYRYADWDELLFDLHQVKCGISPESFDPKASVIAPPNPDAHPAERTIRLSVQDLRRFRQQQAFTARFSWLRVGGCIGSGILFLAATTLIIYLLLKQFELL